MQTPAFRRKIHGARAKECTDIGVT